MYIKYESKKLLEYIVNNMHKEDIVHGNFKYKVLLLKAKNGFPLNDEINKTTVDILNISYCDNEIDILELTRGYWLYSGNIASGRAIYRRRNTDKFYIVEKNLGNVGEVID